MNNQVAIFSRLAGYAVNKQLTNRGHHISTDYVQAIINKANHINYMLMNAAIKMINKAKADSDVNTDELALKLNEIIYGSIENFVKKV
ncbi:MAG: hypothetical protein H6551_08270 [Chitinophagales bacterium]|nr:hypothetical protein [Chitinophagaceae bacterium]MCB9065117.1 hypothetical protein [Chitinophagales bacterium]